MASSSNHTTTSGYEGIGILLVVVVLILCCWSCFIGRAETKALQQFDRALEVQR